MAAPKMLKLPSLLSGFFRCRCQTSLHTTGVLQNDQQVRQFDESLLEYIACPLSKKPLRTEYEMSSEGSSSSDKEHNNEDHKWIYLHGEITSMRDRLLDLTQLDLCFQENMYDKEKNELISDTAGVAYPVVNGVPNLVPQDARMLKTDSGASTDKSKTSIFSHVLLVSVV